MWVADSHLIPVPNLSYSIRASGQEVRIADQGPVLNHVALAKYEGTSPAAGSR